MNGRMVGMKFLCQVVPVTDNFLSYQSGNVSPIFLFCISNYDRIQFNFRQRESILRYYKQAFLSFIQLYSIYYIVRTIKVSQNFNSIFRGKLRTYILANYPCQIMQMRSVILINLYKRHSIVRNKNATIFLKFTNLLRVLSEVNSEKSEMFHLLFKNLNLKVANEQVCRVKYNQGGIECRAYSLYITYCPVNRI